MHFIADSYYDDYDIQVINIKNRSEEMTQCVVTPIFRPHKFVFFRVNENHYTQISTIRYYQFDMCVLRLQPYLQNTSITRVRKIKTKRQQTLHRRP